MSPDYTNAECVLQEKNDFIVLNNRTIDTLILIISQKEVFTRRR